MCVTFRSLRAIRRSAGGSRATSLLLRAGLRLVDYSLSATEFCEICFKDSGSILAGSMVSHDQFGLHLQQGTRT